MVCRCWSMSAPYRRIPWLAADASGTVSVMTAATTTEPVPTTWTSKQKLTLVATGLGLFMVFMDVLIVNVALPDIQRSFGVGEAGVQWVVAAYSIGMCSAGFWPPSGVVADRRPSPLRLRTSTRRCGRVLPWA